MGTFRDLLGSISAEDAARYRNMLAGYDSGEETEEELDVRQTFGDTLPSTARAMIENE